MQPEDIDKLFRDHLDGHAPTPPAYLWNQLEEELQPPKKRPVLWLWAAAASVLLLLATGVVWLQRGPGHPTGAGALATAQPAKKIRPASDTQATTAPQLASTPPAAVAVAAPAASPRQAREAHRPARPQATAAASARRSRSARPAVEPEQPAAVMAATSPAQPERRPVLAPTPAATPRALAAAPAATGPIVVEVYRSEPAPAVATADAADDSGTPQRPRLGQLLRQARHVVRGERVSLAEAGLPETVTLQARVAGHTLTKVIQL